VGLKTLNQAEGRGIFEKKQNQICGSLVGALATSQIETQVEEGMRTALTGGESIRCSVLVTKSWRASKARKFPERIIEEKT